MNLSKMITTQAFTTYFILYTFASLVLALGISFTGAALIIYFFSLLPFYLICTLYCFNPHSALQLLRHILVTKTRQFDDTTDRNSLIAVTQN